MKLVSREVVNNYWWNKWLPRVYLVGLFLVIVVGMGLAHFYFHSPCSMVLLGALIGTALALCSHPVPEKLKKELDPSDFQLLRRWDRYSGFSLSEFPSSEIRMVLLKSQVVVRMKKLALALNEAFREQEELVQRINSFEEEIPQRKADWYKAELDRLNANACAAKAAYLGCWDLMIEIGILGGYAWDDPEGFRKKVLWIYSQKG